jgi:hypothetical protein
MSDPLLIVFVVRRNLEEGVSVGIARSGCAKPDMEHTILVHPRVADRVDFGLGIGGVHRSRRGASNFRE